MTKACPPKLLLTVPILHDCRTAGSQGIYVDSSIGINPFRVQNGWLTIFARKLPATQAARWKRAYATGWLSTKFSFAQRYGYFEMRAVLPAGKGLWPAFWLMPVLDGWPAYGEIDAMESLGVDGIFYASIHAKPGGRELHETVAVKTPGTTLTRAFHTYGVAWTPREIVYYLDRKEVSRRPTPVDVNQPMYMIVNLATGGSWPGSMTVTNGQYVIDRVTAWQVPR